MPVYKRRVSTRHPRFHARVTIIKSYDTPEDLLHDTNPKTVNVIPVPDTIVLCNGCNQNIYSAEQETFVWLIYLGKRELKADQPYDGYCDDCVKRHWPEAIKVK